MQWNNLSRHCCSTAKLDECAEKFTKRKKGNSATRKHGSPQRLCQTDNLLYCDYFGEKWNCFMSQLYLDLFCKRETKLKTLKITTRPFIHTTTHTVTLGRTWLWGLSGSSSYQRVCGSIHDSACCSVRGQHTESKIALNGCYVGVWMYVYEFLMSRLALCREASCH